MLLPATVVQLDPSPQAVPPTSHSHLQTLSGAVPTQMRPGAQSADTAHVARYAFQLAQSFSNFYQKYPILIEENREKKVFLLWMTDFFRRQLERTAGVLGIRIPEYM